MFDSFFLESKFPEFTHIQWSRLCKWCFASVAACLNCVCAHVCACVHVWDTCVYQQWNWNESVEFSSVNSIKWMKCYCPALISPFISGIISYNSIREKDLIHSGLTHSGWIYFHTNKQKGWGFFSLSWWQCTTRIRLTCLVF